MIIVGIAGAAGTAGITGLTMTQPAPSSGAPAGLAHNLAATAAPDAVAAPTETGTASAAGAASAADIAADAALVAECRRGTPGALERLVERFQTDVFGTALRLTRDRDVALELTNSIFFKIYQNLHAFEPGRPLRPWLLRIATNESLNWLRSRRREREHVLSGEASDVAFEQLPGGIDPEDAALVAERRETVREALARLPEHYRLVLTLRFFNDLSYQEIAEHTGQDANTVGVQLLRGRQLLKRELLSQESPR